jgi:hypothetical protein
MPINKKQPGPNQSTPPPEYVLGGNFPADPWYIDLPMGNGMVNVDTPTARYKMALHGVPSEFHTGDIISVQLALKPFLMINAKQSEINQVERGSTG